MGWIKTYQIPFQSRLRTQYMVYVLEQGDTQGTVTQLTGAGEPFVTCEDDSDDIFTSIRKQTGYLRIIDTDGTAMESLMPRNNVEKMVQLWSGTWNSSFTTFTDGELQWQGFLCAQAYTQPARNDLTEIEFPVKSMLAALEDVHLDYEDAARLNRIGYIIAKASMVLKGGTQSPWSNYLFIEDAGDNTTIPAIVDAFINWGVLFEDVSTKNNGMVIDTPSYYDALSTCTALFGMQFREEGATLICAQYDRGENCQQKLMTWTQMQRTVNPIMISPSFSYEGEMATDSTTLPGMTFLVGNSNRSFIQGASKFAVKVSLSDNKFTLGPGASERSDDTPYSIPCQERITILTQPHETSSHAATLTEVFLRYAHTVTYEWRTVVGSYWVLHWTEGTASTFADLVNESVMMPSGRSRFLDGARSTFATGSTPVRWSKGGVLQSALWLNLLPVLGMDMYTPKEIYSVSDSRPLQPQEGYLHLNFTINRFRLDDGNYIFWNKDVLFGIREMGVKLTFKLQVGTKYWSGSQWVDNEVQFTINTRHGAVVSNSSHYSDLPQGGYYIPADNISGVVKLSIYNIANNGRGGGNNIEMQIFSFIMTNLLVSWIPKTNITGTEEGENNYFRQSENGFAGKMESNLIIGTYNANQPSGSFIQKLTQTSPDITYGNIESLNYRTDGGDSSIEERPEIHLLDRMAEQGAETRESIYYQTRDAIADIMTTVFERGNKKYFCVEAKRSWRDDQREAKFIEIT